MTPQTTSIDPNTLAPREAYKLLISSVIPRPIGWISTVSADGINNLAPYSFFNGVSGAPPIVMFSVSRPRTGRLKDTLSNVRETEEFVVNIVSHDLTEAMNQTAGEWDADVDEFALAGLTAAPCINVKAPRVAEARVAMEAKLTQILPIDGSESTVVFGQIVRFHIHEALLGDDGLVDPRKLEPVGRLGGADYSAPGEVFSVERPK